MKYLVLVFQVVSFVVGRCGSLWVVVDHCGSFRVLVTAHQNFPVLVDFCLIVKFHFFLFILFLLLG